MLDFVNAAVGLGTLGYNMYRDNQNRKDYLRQQEYSNWFAENATSIKMKDMQNAGLHPTLAVGGHGATPPPVGSAGHRETHAPQIMLQNAAMKSQIAFQNAQTQLSQAQAEKIRSENALLKPQYDLSVSAHDLAWQGHFLSREIHNADRTIREGQLTETRRQVDAILKDADTRRFDYNMRKDLHDWEKSLRHLEFKRREFIRDQESTRKLIMSLEYDYIKKYGYKMPSNTVEFSELQKIAGKNAIHSYYGVEFARDLLDFLVKTQRVKSIPKKIPKKK